MLLLRISAGADPINLANLSSVQLPILSYRTDVLLVQDDNREVSIKSCQYDFNRRIAEQIGDTFGAIRFDDLISPDPLIPVVSISRVAPALD